MEAGAYLLRMALIDPVKVGFIVVGVMLDSDGVAQMVQEFFGAPFHGYVADNCMRCRRLYNYRMIILIHPDDPGYFCI